MQTVSSAPAPDSAVPGAKAALALLLTINLFNYIDRQVLSAILPRLAFDGSMFEPNDPDIQFKLGMLTSAFLAAYMICSPIVGWLDGHGYRRWVILGLGVTVWSIASGSSGFATGYWMLFAMRCFVGVGEGAYGPVASALLADVFPARQRGAVMAAFNLAIPVGSALGFVIGGQVADAFGDWRPAFWVTYAGLLLGAWCFLKRELPRPMTAKQAENAPGYFETLRRLAVNKSFVLCCVGMTAVTFVLGGVAAWVPTYVYQREARFELKHEKFRELAKPPEDSFRRPLPPYLLERLRPKADGFERTLPEFRAHVADALQDNDAALYFDSITTVSTTEASPTLGTINTIFGGIVVLGGLLATIFGAWVGEKLRSRVSGAYFLVIAGGAFFALPCFIALIYSPFPTAWVFIFLAVFGLFLHTGPGFTILANVVTTEMRATAFAINILVIHALGDVISPPLIGFVADRSNLDTAFLLTSVMIFVGGVTWFLGARFLEADTKRAEGAAITPE